MWTKNDIEINIQTEMSDDSIVTATIETPLGTVHIMGALSEVGRVLHVDGFNIHGLERGKLGNRGLYDLDQVVMDTLEDFDEIVVTGTARTTGANPGHYPRPFRFRRKTATKPVDG